MEGLRFFLNVKKNPQPAAMAEHPQWKHSGAVRDTQSICIVLNRSKLNAVDPYWTHLICNNPQWTATDLPVSADVWYTWRIGAAPRLWTANIQSSMKRITELRMCDPALVYLCGPPPAAAYPTQWKEQKPKLSPSIIIKMTTFSIPYLITILFRNYFIRDRKKKFLNLIT